MSLIKLNNISVTYNNNVEALKDVSLKIEKGDFVVVMGKSGCGKSTLLNIIGGIKKADEGTYFFGKDNVNEFSDGEMAEFRNKNIGFVVQHFALINEKTVYDNIALPLIYRKCKRKEIDAKVKDIIKKLELEDKIKAYPYQLSGGQCQRVAIARAIIGEPDLIIADEPTGALDEETGKKIVDILKEINKKGTTILMVTHDSSFENVGNRCVKMKDHRILDNE